MYNVTTSNETYVYPEETVVLSGLSCCFSLFGAVLIFVSYWIIPEIRNTTRKLVLWLTLADTLTAAGYMLGVARYAKATGETATGPDVPALCLMQSILTTYSSLVSFFLTVFVALYITISEFRRHDWPDTRCYVVTVNVISWLIPAAVIGVAYYYHVLGEDRQGLAGTGPWCWIDTSRTTTGLGPIFWMTFTGKGWEILCYVLTTVFYFLLKITMYLRRRDDGIFYAFHASVRREDRNFLYVWLVLYILRLWGTIRFFTFAACFRSSIDVDSYDIMKTFLYLQAFGDPLQAFCNSILVCVLDKPVRSAMLVKIKSCCSLRATSRSSMTSLNAPRDSEFEESSENEVLNSNSSNYLTYNTRVTGRMVV